MKFGLKAIGFVLALVLLFSFSGCVKKEVNGPTSSEPSVNDSTISSTESTESEDDSAMYEGKTGIKVLSYNIRCLRGGDQNAGYEPLGEGEITATINNFSALLDREEPDIFILCENRMFFDAKATESEGGRKNVYDFFFKDYFRYGYNLESGASLPRVYSKYKILDVEYVDVAYEPGNGGGRRPLSVKIKVGDTEIYVIACHPEAGSEVYETSRKPYFEALAEYARDKENVIIGGDLNTDSPLREKELDLFKGDFTFGNFGEFGTFPTYRFGNESERYLDNILVKGLKMRNFRVGSDELSDHYPIFSEVYIMN